MIFDNKNEFLDLPSDKTNMLLDLNKNELDILIFVLPWLAEDPNDALFSQICHW